MKNLILCLGLIMSSWTADVLGQTSKVVFDSVAYMRQYQIYMAATKYSDSEIARGALYNMLMLNPAGANAIADSLAQMYLEENMFASAAILSQDILAGNPNSETAQEVGAYAFEQIGLGDKALPLYESIYLRTNDVVTLYKISLIQFQLGNYVESKTNLDIILSKKEADEVKLYFPGADQQQQEVPLKAAVFNMKGLLAKAKENKEDATKYYKQAILLSPGFQMAIANLQELDN